jgi:hypothetical protein
VADPDSTRKRIAKIIRMLGSSGGERRSALAALEKAMQSGGVGWTDLGDWIEHDDGSYSEAEMQELAQAARAEGVETGIKIGELRAHNGNGHLTLPSPSEMARYCHGRLGQLKDDKQRGFIIDMLVVTRQHTNLSKPRLGYLASIFIQIGGKT